VIVNMNLTFLKSVSLLLFLSPLMVAAGEASGTGSMIAGPLVRVWADAYTARTPGAVIKYNGSNPADGIKRLAKKEVDFSGIDMPLDISDLKKDGLMQFPVALGGVAPVVNLPNVYPGQFKLDGVALADILLGTIKKWNDPALVALNPTITLPDRDIVIVHRVSPPGISTIVGDYLAKVHPQWKSIKGDGMAGTWPASSIEVKDPNENIAKIRDTPYSIGYGPVPQIMKNKLAYVQLKNQAGKFVSPGDENISAAAENAKWDESSGFDVVLTNQPGATSWPLSFASYILTNKVSPRPESSRELLKYLKYSLRYGGLKAIQYDYIPLPESVKAIISSSFTSIVDEKGAPILKN
jgi:phosphate transport system substrate-binding protein